MAKNLFIDFETRSACDIKAHGADVYARDETTEVLCLGYAFDSAPIQIWLPSYGELPTLILEHVTAGGKVVGHNIGGFEIPIWNHVCTRKYGFPILWSDQVVCTMAMAYAMALPGSLEKSAAALGIENGKDAKGQRIMLQLSQPRDVTDDGKITWWENEEKFKALINYCKRDVEVEREIFKRMFPLSSFETRVWQLDHNINQRGVGVDLVSLRAAIALVESERKRLDSEIRSVTQNQVATCSAASQIKEWLRTKGIETDGVDKGAVLDLLSDPSLPSDVRSALLLRQEAAKSSTAKLEAMLNRACEDGRIRSTTQYHGAGTGRWAGRGIQVQNFPRPKLAQLEIEALFKILGGIELEELRDPIRGS